mmetsp:Transcript_50372/g.146150  ORF Transcript_50372/g.146150 Transcript_50372/m.146150 type:complete len:210 (+) Transcript_50372:62-691(+)
MPDFIVPLLLAKSSSAAVLAGAAASPSVLEDPTNVFGEKLQTCNHGVSATGYFRDDLCEAPGDPNHHEVCADITPEFWPESGQPPSDISGNWCICVKKLGDWLQGSHGHNGITGINCAATSSHALHRSPAAAQYIAEHCHVSPQGPAESCADPLSVLTWSCTATRPGKEKRGRFRACGSSWPSWQRPLGDTDFKKRNALAADADHSAVY